MYARGGIRGAATGNHVTGYLPVTIRHSSDLLPLVVSSLYMPAMKESGDTESLRRATRNASRREVASTMTLVSFTRYSMEVWGRK